MKDDQTLIKHFVSYSYSFFSYFWNLMKLNEFSSFQVFSFSRFYFLGSCPYCSILQQQ